jgi:hypothetical protein
MFEFPIERPEGLTDEQWYALANRALSYIKSVTPVKTGKLRKGWQLGDLGPDGFTLQNDVDYAPYVNDGTDRMAPRDMTGQTLAYLM